MIDLTGYEDVPATAPGEFSKLPAGGYICQVINAEITTSKAGNPMLVLFLDIAEGDFQHHFKNALARVKSYSPDIKWDKSGIYRQLIFDNGKVSRFFKGLLNCFQKSNPNFSFKPHAFDENILRGSLIGFIFAEEEYLWNDEVKIRVFPKFPKSIEVIRAGVFKVPDIKRIENTTTKQSKPAANSFTDFNEPDLPF